MKKIRTQPTTFWNCLCGQPNKVNRPTRQQLDGRKSWETVKICPACGKHFNVEIFPDGITITSGIRQESPLRNTGLPL